MRAPECVLLKRRGAEQNFSSVACGHFEAGFSEKAAPFSEKGTF